MSGYDSDKRRDRDSFTVQIDESYGVISRKDSGWTKELNLVGWNGNKAKFDIREWDPEHKRMTKGVTLTREELDVLHGLIGSICGSVCAERDGGEAAESSADIKASTGQTAHSDLE